MREAVQSEKMMRFAGMERGTDWGIILVDPEETAADMMRSKAVVLHARPSGFTSRVLTGRFEGRNISPDSDSLWSLGPAGLLSAKCCHYPRIVAEVMTATIPFDLSSLSQMSLMNFNAHVCMCVRVWKRPTAGLASCFNMSSSHWCVLSDQRCDLSRNIFIWRRDPLLSIP